MKTYSVTPLKLIEGICYRCDPDDPRAVWSVCSYDDEAAVTQWVADTCSKEMALTLVDVLERAALLERTDRT